MDGKPSRDTEDIVHRVHPNGQDNIREMCQDDKESNLRAVSSIVSSPLQSLDVIM